MPEPTPVVVDGDPLHEAIANAVWEQCRTEGPSTVVDDPRNIAAVAANVATNPPGSTREQLPADLLALLPARSYLSTACETARLLEGAAIAHPQRATELRDWRDRMHTRCRLNNKFTGAGCTCRCHTTDDEESPR